MVGGGVLIAKTNNCVNHRIIGTLLSTNRRIVTSSLHLSSMSSETRGVIAGVFRPSSNLFAGLNSPSIYLRVT